MSDTAKVQNSRLTVEQKKLINTALSGNITRFREYRLNSTQDPDVNPRTGQPKKRDSLKPDGAIFFEYLAYNSFRMFIEEPTSNGFFYHSYQRIEEEYGIGKDRVQKITAYLRDIGVVETKVCGLPKNTHYRIRFDKLATVEVAIRLYKTAPDRTREIVTHYAEMAKAVKLREETSSDQLKQEYPAGLHWFELLKKTFYDERTRFNKTVPPEDAHKKLQPKPNSATLRNIEREVAPIYYDTKNRKRSPTETEQWRRTYINGFRLYCALYFHFTSNDASTDRDLEQLAQGDYADLLVNYASSIRDPIAYFFAEHEDGWSGLVSAYASDRTGVDFTTGYFTVGG